MMNNYTYGLKSFKIEEGSIVKVGRYYIDSPFSKDPLDWIVLAISGNKALLITKEAINFLPYHNDCCCVTWENCFLRRWLNTDFFYEAFSVEERQAIKSTTLSTKSYEAIKISYPQIQKESIEQIAIES